MPNVTRVFLENGDPFALSADRLEAIAVMIHEYLPKVETIAMYASIKNVIGNSFTIQRIWRWHSFWKQQN